MKSFQPTVVVPLRRQAEKRGAARVETMQALSLKDGQPATLCNLSATGLAFAAQQAHAPGLHIELTIDYLLDGHNFPMQCKAVVLRCEPAASGYIIGARLLVPLLDSE